MVFRFGLAYCRRVWYKGPSGCLVASCRSLIRALVLFRIPASLGAAGSINTASASGSIGAASAAGSIGASGSISAASAAGSIGAAGAVGIGDVAGSDRKSVV